MLGARHGDRGRSAWTDQQRHVDDVIHSLRSERTTATDQSGAFERESKMSKLEQISSLMNTLQEEGIGTNDVIAPTLGSSMSEIDDVLAVLILKNERNRMSTITEEFIGGAAEFLSTVLDGKTPIPVLGWCPDYTGYHSVVQVKLYRMRHETSQIVGNFLHGSTMSPGLRILMELMPSLLLYPRQNQRERGRSILNDPVISGASANASSALASLNNLRQV